MPKNEWRCDNEYSYGVWEIFLEVKDDTREKVFNLIDVMLELGEKHRIYQLRYANNETLFGTTERHEYLLSLRNKLDKRGFIQIFESDKERFWQEIFASSFVCVFKDNVVCEEQVENLGLRLIELEKEDFSKKTIHMADSVSPITIKGEYVQKDQFLDIWIDLHTDIWFPYILGRNNPANQLRDNRLLALFHSPRLNKFLEELEAFVRNSGGEWIFEADRISNPHYRKQVNSLGIELRPIDTSP